jgi:uncharacterized repeat protein (TIGR01451 family)
MQLTLKASADSANLGDKVTYAYEVRNTGGVELTGVTILDDEPGTVVCPSETLKEGATMTCKPTDKRGPHTVTLDDVRKGQIGNRATALTDQTGPVTDAVIVTVNQHPKITVAKTCPIQRESGETLAFMVSVTNAGDLSMSNVKAVDDRGTPETTDDDLKLTPSKGDVNGNQLLDPGETWLFEGSYVVGNSPDAEAATTTVQATPVTDRASAAVSVSATATCTTQIQWGDEACTSTFWSSHPDLWDGKGAGDVTTTIQGGSLFNTTFGVTSAQSGVDDGLTLLQATSLSGGDKSTLARYAAVSLANADAGIAYRYRVAEVVKLYRDAIGADSGPETIASVLAKPSAQEMFTCPADLTTRNLVFGGSDPGGGPVAQQDAEESAGSAKPSVGDRGAATPLLKTSELMVLLGALQLLGLGGLGYRQRHRLRLRRANRWR